MKVKRFVAPNMRLALQMVREELGSDAIILSNKRVKNGVELLTAADEKDTGIETPVDSLVSESNIQPLHVNAERGIERYYAKKDAEIKSQSEQPSKLEVELDRMQRGAKQRAAALAAQMAKKDGPLSTDLYSSVSEPVIEQSTYIEETAAVEKPSSNINAPAEQASLHTLSSQGRPVAQQDNAGEPPKSSVINAEHSFTRHNRRENDAELANMRFELESMRELLEQQLSSMTWSHINDSEPHKASMWKRLKRMGLGAKVADALLEQVDSEGSAKEQWQQLMKRFCESLNVADADPIMSGGVFVFVGPTGAGKTTTIGKLATRYVLEHGADSVALITCDNYRIAAHDQLRTFGRILNVPVKIVDKNNSLERVLFSLRHKKLILIDSAGLNPRDQRLRQQLQTINELGGRAKTLMVIPVTSQSQVLKTVYQNYITDNLHACILTKLDEAGSLGGVLDLVIGKQLPIAYCSNGQDIPDDLQLADRDTLVRQCLDLAKHAVADNNTMVDEMARLWKRHN